MRCEMNVPCNVRTMVRSAVSIEWYEEHWLTHGAVKATKTSLSLSKAISSKLPALSWTAAGGAGGLIFDLTPDCSVTLHSQHSLADSA